MWAGCSSTASAPSNLSSCEPSWMAKPIGGTQMCFKSFGKKAAPDARRTCEANDARLPLPKNRGENADYRAAFNSLVGIGPFIWLAVDDVAKEGTFVNTHTGEKSMFLSVTFWLNLI